MAHLVDSRLRAQDNSGNAYSGATLTVYETTTTTPASLYSTAALAAAAGTGDLANPLTGDAAGYFPTVFVTETEIVDLICKTSAGVTLWQVNGVQGVPGAAEGFALDFGGDGRVRFVGGGNIVNLEAGDPTGDDLGGDLRIGGYESTQGTSLELDFLSTTNTGNETIQGNLEVTGTLTQDSIAQDVVVSHGTATAVSTLDIPLPSAYFGYELYLWYVSPSASLELQARFSFDNGATYKAGSDYVTSVNGASAATDTEIVLTAANMQTPTGHTNNFRLTIFTHPSRETGLMSQGGSTTTALTGAAVVNAYGYTAGKAYGRASHIRILTSIGTINCFWSLRGIIGP